MRLGDRLLDLTQPQVMAIVNVTPDSFYSGARTMDDEAIAARVRQVVDEGASIIDIGGYSSRPGAEDVSVEQEWERVSRALAVVQDVAKDVAVSVDTFRAEVARLSIEQAGAIIINDISAGEADAAMVEVVAHYGVPYVAMHMRGTPQTMQQHTTYERGVVTEVSSYFDSKLEWLEKRGVKDIILDPGFGFAKSVEQNYELLSGLHLLRDKGCPLLVGISRKSMIYKVLNTSSEEALNGTSALHWEALQQGATILRVHDVREACEVVKLWQNYKKWQSI